jgi:hypothetical protein
MPNYTNDSNMTYDLSTHRYTLTKEAVLNDKGIDLDAIFGDNPDVDVPAFLKRVSLEVYSALLSGVKSKDKTLYVLSLSSHRNDILEVLEEHAFDLMTARTDPGAFFSNYSSLHQLSQLAFRMASDSGIYFRGEWSQEEVPFGFMTTKGIDW